MQPGDLFYLCYGNNIQLLGKVRPERSWEGKWLGRKYTVLKKRRLETGKYKGHKRGWTPNYNSTCWLVPVEQLHDFEKRILRPYFAVKLTDLPSGHPTRRFLPGTFEDPDFAPMKGLPRRRYEEARKRLVRHSKLETMRNPALVRDGKRVFRDRNGSLFCEVCKFDFEAEYGERGKDFIEAHHRMPISRLRGRTALKIRDLAMACPNCHRMLHRPPWITVQALRAILKRNRLQGKPGTRTKGLPVKA
jgi:hypothetical protein